MCQICIQIQIQMNDKNVDRFKDLDKMEQRVRERMAISKMRITMPIIGETIVHPVSVDKGPPN